MKVFISHKKEDSLYAQFVKRQLDLLKVDSYLDVLDTSINGGGEALTDHIKDQLNSCTDIIVVMSEATKYRSLHETILRHIQMGIDFHCRSYTGMADRFGESGQIEIRVVFMLDVIVGHISVPESMHGDIVSQTNLLTNFSVSLAGTAADTATKREVGRTADVLMFSADRIVLLFDNPLS